MKTNEFQVVYSLLLRIMEELAGGKIPVPAAIELSHEGTLHKDVVEEAGRWLWVLDAGIQPHLLRRTVEKLNPSEPELQALVRYFAQKSRPEHEDIERLEWLLTYLFRRSSAGKNLPPNQVLLQIHELLGPRLPAYSVEAEDNLKELAEIRSAVTACRTFRELTDSGLIARGRRVKQELKDELSNTELLAAVIHYNLITGAKFQGLLAEAMQGPVELPSGLATKEYRSAAEHFQKWSRKVAANSAQEKSAPSRPRAPGPVQVPSQKAAPSELRIDPKVEEGRLLATTSKLMVQARAAGAEAINSIALDNCEFLLSPLELSCLQVEYPPAEKSFRVELCVLVRRTVGLMASIQEEAMLFKVRRTSEYLWKKHLNTLLYLSDVAAQVAPELDFFVAEARRRGLHQKAEELANTAKRLRGQMRNIAAFNDPDAAAASQCALQPALASA